MEFVISGTPSGYSQFKSSQHRQKLLADPSPENIEDSDELMSEDVKVHDESEVIETMDEDEAKDAKMFALVCKQKRDSTPMMFSHIAPNESIAQEANFGQLVDGYSFSRDAIRDPSKTNSPHRAI